MAASDGTGTFRIKTGRCRIDSDRIELEHRDTGNLRNVYDGLIAGHGSVARKLLAWAVTLAFVGATALGFYYVPWFGVVLTVAIIVVFGISYYRKRKYRYTDANEIPLDAVEAVTFRKGVAGLTRPRFVVRYRDGDVRKRRYVLLPSDLYAETDDAIATAKNLFAAHGFTVEE